MARAQYGQALTDTMARLSAVNGMEMPASLALESSSLLVRQAG